MLNKEAAIAIKFNSLPIEVKARLVNKYTKHTHVALYRYPFWIHLYIFDSSLTDHANFNGAIVQCDYNEHSSVVERIVMLTYDDLGEIFDKVKINL
jgi:hypothetical protein